MLKLPDSPGVYFFLDKKGKIFYIGKATSLRNRVRSYFDGKVGEKRGPLIEEMVSKKPKIKFRKTDSVLEALLLEAELIKKHYPPYNSKGKDQRSWNYVAITQEEFPKILILRETKLQANNYKLIAKYGPFPHSSELKTALKIIRKIFPFRDRCHLGQNKPCFDAQIGLCPGVCTGQISQKEYSNILKNIGMILEGRKKALVKKLEKEMKILAKERKFEEAGKIKRQIFSLRHINEVALLDSKLQTPNSKLPSYRIEAYDISHISGTNIVGVMTVIENGEINKNEYRKFKIKDQKGVDDTKALKEILERRLKHSEWRYPNFIVVDGGKAQINVAQKIFKNIPIVGVVKNKRHKPREILGKFEKSLGKLIFLANSEAHRFAVAFHRKIRNSKTVDKLVF